MSIKIVLLVALSYQTILQGTRPIVTLYASQLGASTFDVGLLTATYAFFPLIFAIYIGKIADRIGDRVPTVVGTTGLAMGMAIPFFFPSLLVLYISQALTGISQVLINVSLQNVVGNSSNKEARDHHFSLFSLAISLGGLIGPIIGGNIADRFSFHMSYLVALFMGIIPIFFSFFIPVIIRSSRKHQKEDSFKKSSSFELLKTPVVRKAIASGALVLYSRDIYVAYFPLYAASLGMTTSTIGTILTLQGLAMVAIRALLSKLTGKFGREKVLHFSINLAGIAFILTPLLSNSYLFGILAIFMGAGLGCGQPLSMSITYNASPKDRTGEVLGLRLGVNRLSQTVAPLLFGFVGSFGGLMPVFYLSGLFLLGGSYYTRSKEDEKEMNVEMNG